jgi:hypothetical protein
MRVSLLSLCIGVALGGCQTAPTYSGNQSDHVTVVHAGNAAVSVVGTPFYLAFKGVTCAVSALVAAPVAGISAVSESRSAPKIREDLGDGLRQNCGPPYALSPYRVVSVESAPAAPTTPARGQPPETPPGITDDPDPLSSLEPALGLPDTPTPAHLPEPPADDSGEPAAAVPGTSAPGQPSETPTGISDVPAPPITLEPALGPPENPAPGASAGATSEESEESLTNAFPEPAAGGLIKLFNGG